MGKLPQKTHEIQTEFLLGMRDSQDWVDWAVDAIVDGFDSSSLRILAGLQPPLDRDEVTRLWPKAFVELNIRPIEHKNCIPFYVSTVIRRTLTEKRPPNEALGKLKDLCCATNYDSRLMDFYLLFFALTDLEAGEMQWYWKGATADNVHQIVDDYLGDWLKNFDQNFSQ